MSEFAPTESPQDPRTIRRMFNAIAPTYDLLNHLLSFGMDIRWRKQALRMLKEKQGGAVMLDIAAGSGDLTLEALTLSPSLVIATDFAEEMLRICRQKLDRRQEPPPQGRDRETVPGVAAAAATPAGAAKVELAVCDALALPFAAGSFDATMVAFGIRNFADRLRSLREMRRVLRPGGLSLILELSVPSAPLAAFFYTLYARAGLPLLGKIISHHTSAYRYLPDSIARFPQEQEFRALMEEAGFREVRSIPLSFGAATVYIGRK